MIRGRCQCRQCTPQDVVESSKISKFRVWPWDRYVILARGCIL
jgi:hypothetical protein